MKAIKFIIEKNYRVLVIGFFVAYLLVGTIIFKDYGISCDEQVSRSNGRSSLRYVLAGGRFLFEHPERYHGPAFEIFLVIVEKILIPFNNLRLTYLIRHLLTFFLFYISVIFFYKLCRKRFASWKLGLLGSLFLILSPRIFADSFYNSKDIAFLSVFIISIYTLIGFLDKMTIRSALIHALACAFLIGIRIPGIIVPLFTVIFAVLDLLADENPKIKFEKFALGLTVYIPLLLVFMVFFWPLLWLRPVYHFIEAFKQMSHYPFAGYNLYSGSYVMAGNLPWHYIPIWIIVSTPVLYIICFFIGFLFSLNQLRKNPVSFYSNRRNDLIFLGWFLLPLLAVICLKSVLYDAWRQMFFIYPALLLFSLIGLFAFLKYIRIIFKGATQKAIILIFIIFVPSGLIGTAYSMIKWHPFQNVYFNFLAGRNPETIKNNFELDFYGLSYRQAAEYILETDKRSSIKIYATGITNFNILPKKEKERLVSVKTPEEAEYFLSNYRWHKEEYPYKNEYYSIKVNGLKIMVVFKLKEG